jgi:hypothetical protein
MSKATAADERALDARNTAVRELDLMRQAIDNKQLKKHYFTKSWQMQPLMK